MTSAWDYSSREAYVLGELPRRLADLDPHLVALFGSRASGSARVDSDYDLLVVMDLAEPKQPRTLEIRRRLRGLGVPFDIVVFTPEEWARAKDHPRSLAHDILPHAKVLLGAA